MRKRLHNGLLLALILALLFSDCSVLAGVAGKISGVVEDIGTGEPLVGATIRVVGTALVTSTDNDGEYFFINVPVGKIDVMVTHVGFDTMTKRDVRVLVDLTTPVDFSLKQMAVELNESVVVYAEAPVIQRDLTASRDIFTSDRLKNLPNIVTVQNVLTNYPGVVSDRNDEIHVRGGRSGQLSYYYDGLSVQDPFIAGAGIRIMPSALEELSLTSGGFEAEYGEALSGVVNAVTREGVSSYHGGLRAYEGFTHSYDVNRGEWQDLDHNGTRSLSFDISGPIPGADGRRNTFFAAGEYLRDDGYLPHDWEVSYTGATKLSLQPLSGLKLKANMTVSDAKGDLYKHRDHNDRSYDFNLDGLPSFERRAYLWGASGSYYFNEYTILSATVNQFSTWRRQSPRHLMGVHFSDWPGYSEDENGVYNGTIHRDNYGNNPDYTDPYEFYGFTSGDDFEPTYEYRSTEYNAVGADIVQQVNKANQVKAGFDYRRYAVCMDLRQFYNSQPYAETYASNPVYVSAFLQDKIEYAEFVINVGMRYDYSTTDMFYNVTPEDTVETYKQADSKKRLSPRLGMSFPVSTRTVMHFNYGLYYQMPRLYYLYFNPQGDISSGLPLLGNPDLLPEQTTSYEAGLDHLIGDNLKLDVTAYYKDFEDLVTTRTYRVGTIVVTRFTNDDYGSAKGIDIALEKLPVGGRLSGSVSYGYMQAQGNGSNAMETYRNIYSSDTNLVVKEYALDFDQRHTVTAILQYELKDRWTGRLFGLMIPGRWGLSLVGYYGSGLPYTKTDADGNRFGGRNAYRLPAYYSLDMRFKKDFAAGPGRTLTFFVEVDNLFDRRNVIDVYSRTGLPDDDSFQPGVSLAVSDEELDEVNRLYDSDPRHYSPPRAIRTGFELSF